MTPPTRRIVTILAGVLLFGLFAGTGKEKDAAGEQTPSNATKSPAERQVDPEQEKHFTPEVKKFVETFKPAGEGIDGAGGIKAPSPIESLQRFRLSDGLEMEVVASEPVIRQPLNLHFDERGRLWVVQYIQYPFPAGLKVVKYDKLFRRAQGFSDWPEHCHRRRGGSWRGLGAEPALPVVLSRPQ